MLDVVLDYPIASDRSRFSIDPALARLGVRTTTVLRFVPPDGARARVRVRRRSRPRPPRSALVSGRAARSCELGFDAHPRRHRPSAVRVLPGDSVPADPAARRDRHVVHRRAFDHAHRVGGRACARRALVSAADRGADRAVDRVHGAREHRRPEARATLADRVRVRARARLRLLVRASRVDAVRRRAPGDVARRRSTSAWSSASCSCSRWRCRRSRCCSSTSSPSGWGRSSCRRSWRTRRGTGCSTAARCSASIEFQLPAFDAALVASAMRGLMLLLIVVGAAWGMFELYAAPGRGRAGQEPMPGLTSESGVGSVNRDVESTRGGRYRGRVHACRARLADAGRARSRRAADASHAHSRSRGEKATAPSRPSTLSGVYTDEQASRGKDVYTGTCRSCHSPTSHTGATFAKWWRGKQLSDLFTFVSTRMPKNDPGTLAPEDVADVDGVPAQDERDARRHRPSFHPDADSLKKFRIEVKSQRRLPPQRGRSHDATLADAVGHATWEWRSFAGALLSRRVRAVRDDSRARSRARRSCAATSPANGATGAPTRGARATRRSIRSTPSNFDSLQVAWQWNASASTATTSTIARRRSTRTAGCSPSRRRGATRSRSIRPPATTLWQWGLDEGIRWQKAPRQFAGRGLAYWTDGAQRARHRRDARLPPGDPRREDRQGRSEASARTASSISWKASASRSCRSRSTTTVRSRSASTRRRARRSRARSGIRRRRPAPTARSASIRPNGQIAASSPADRRRRRDRRRQLVDPRLLSDCACTTFPGYDPRLRRPHRQAALEVQPHSAAGRVRRRHVEERIEDRHATASARTTRGRTYSADPELGLVYIPVGMPLSDEYGGHRPGDNLFGNSLVAIDVKTGKRKWHFQMVHHDIWDYDTPMAPNLLDVTVNGRAAQDHRADDEAGLGLHVRSRDRRADLADAETPVLQSEVPGEQTSPTQPIPSKPAPYAQQGLLEADLIDYTPAIKDCGAASSRRCAAWGRTSFPRRRPTARARRPSQYTCSWYAPGASGGVNIDGGAAADPETGMLYVGGAERLEHDRGRDTIRARSSATRQPHDSCGKLGALPPPPGYVRRRRAEGAGAAADFAPRRPRHDDRRHLDPQAEGAGRHHGLRHEHRRQEVVGAERQPLARARRRTIRSSPA